MNLRITIDQIPIGSVCDFNILDENGVLLLRQGERLTQAARDRIVRRGVQFVSVTESEYAAFAQRLAKTTTESKGTDRPLKGLSRVDRHEEAYCPLRAKERSGKIQQSSRMLAMLGSRINELSPGDLKLLMDGPAELLPMLLDDSDQTICALYDTNDECSLAQRSIQLSVLAMNTAIEMELFEEETLAIGLAGLIHDLALFAMPKRMQESWHELTDDESWQYRRHPILVEKRLSSHPVIAPHVLAMVRQVHERLDGSGYPIGMGSNVQHPHAKILSLVDFYLTMILPGPNRPAIVPIDAIRLLISETNQGRFDWVVLRAFIAHMTLYAIGSDVELDDGRQVTIVRRNRHHFARPIVEQKIGPNTVRIDLAASENRVVRPILDPTKNQMRFEIETATYFNASFFER